MVKGDGAGLGHGNHCVCSKCTFPTPVTIISLLRPLHPVTYAVHAEQLFMRRISLGLSTDKTAGTVWLLCVDVTATSVQIVVF